MYSQPTKLALLDRRLAEAELVEHFKADLIRHGGGAQRVTAVQRALIDRAGAPYLRLWLMDRATLDKPIMPENAGREYLCRSNALTRAVR